MSAGHGGGATIVGIGTRLDNDCPQCVAFSIISPPAQTENRHFLWLSALHAHTCTKPPYKIDLLWETLRPIKRSGRARTVVWISSAQVNQSAYQGCGTCTASLCCSRGHLSFVYTALSCVNIAVEPENVLYMYSSPRTLAVIIASNVWTIFVSR